MVAVIDREDFEMSAPFHSFCLSSAAGRAIAPVALAADTGLKCTRCGHDVDLSNRSRGGHGVLDYRLSPICMIMSPNLRAYEPWPTKATSTNGPFVSLGNCCHSKSALSPCPHGTNALTLYDSASASQCIA